MVFVYFIQSIIIISHLVSIFSLLFEQQPVFLEVGNEHISIWTFFWSLLTPPFLVQPSSNQQLIASLVIIDIFDPKVHFWKSELHSDLCRFTVIWKIVLSFIYKRNATA